MKLTNKFYQKHKEKLRKESHERYQNLPEEEKERKHQYHCQININLCKEQKQKLVEYRSYYIMRNK